MVFAILDLLEHDSSQASAAPVISPSIFTPDLSLKLGNSISGIGGMEE